MKDNIDRKTMRQKVYDSLRMKLLYGDLLPGQNIKLRDLAEQLDVSPMPVREALWQLESEKLIVIESNRFIRVNGLSPNEMGEALRLRLMLEAEAVKRAARLRPAKAIPEVKRLLTLVKSASNKPKNYMLRNADFHFGMYVYAESPLLIDHINRIWARIVPYLSIYNSREGNLVRTNEYHEQMFEAFRDKDEEEIVKALTIDLETAGKYVIKVLMEI